MIWIIASFGFYGPRQIQVALGPVEIIPRQADVAQREVNPRIVGIEGHGLLSHTQRLRSVRVGARRHADFLAGSSGKEVEGKAGVGAGKARVEGNGTLKERACLRLHVRPERIREPVPLEEQVIGPGCRSEGGAGLLISLSSTMRCATVVTT